MKTSPRQLALDILNRVDTGREILDQLINRVETQWPDPSRRDRALFNTLVYGVLRWRARLDWIVRHFSSTRFEKIEPPVRNVLRLGLYQILYLDRIPVSAAVNTSVELSKGVAAPWATRFVNGVLRTAAREYDAVPFPDPAEDPVGAVSAEKSIPRWLASRWLDQFGLRETNLLCDAINTVPSITLRTNTLITTRDRLITSIARDAGATAPCRFSPEGIQLDTPKHAIHRMTDFKNGGFQVQDEGAQLISYFLGPKPEEHVLDACAGLGGKTGHIAQIMENKGRLTAVDVSQHKLTRLQSEMRRLNIDIARCRKQNLLTETPPDEDTMDRVLLDAPCSGLGVLRRNPDAKWRESKQHLNTYQANQIQLLQNLALLVKPTGILVYSVCSMEPEETDDVINTFLSLREDYALDTDFTAMPTAARCVIDREGRLRTFPHRHGTDGFFAVRLRRKG